MGKKSGCQEYKSSWDKVKIYKEAHFLDILGKRIVVTESHSSSWAMAQGSTLIEVYASRSDSDGNHHWFRESQDYRNTFVGELNRPTAQNRSISNELANLIVDAVKEYGTLLEKWEEER